MVSRVIQLSVLVGFVGLGLLAFCSGQGECSTKLLGADEMQSARGAVPANCKIQFRSGTCDDFSSFCHAKLQGDCSGYCTACTKSGVGESTCSDPTVKPWNALTCTANAPVAGGCGNSLIGSICTWVDVDNSCQCRQGIVIDSACSQVTATSTGVGTCVVQN